nr:MAG TPA: hypothetical protein [Caudoviricetes sp.]
MKLPNLKSSYNLLFSSFIYNKCEAGIFSMPRIYYIQSNLTKIEFSLLLV